MNFFEFPDWFTRQLNKEGARQAVMGPLPIRSSAPGMTPGEEQVSAPPVKRGGRPKGSKNKPHAI